MARTLDLTSIAEAYRLPLRRDATLTEFPLTGYDRVGIPVIATVRDDGSADAHGVGYGPTSDAATVGALGELAERVLLHDALHHSDLEHGSYRELTLRYGPNHVADPVALILDATAEYAPERPLSWVRAVRWRTGEDVFVPAEFAAFDGGSMPPDARRDHLITPITNGMGAGDTLERAVGHGLLELVQRDGDNVVFRALDRGVVLDVTESPSREVHDAIAALQAAGIAPIVKLAGTEYACVVYCVGDDADPSVEPVAISAIGEAAHPDRDVAVAKAVLEFASSRARRIFAFGSWDRVRRLSPDYYEAELLRPVGPQERRALDTMREWSSWDTERMRTHLAPLFRTSRSVPLASLPTTTVDGPLELLSLLLDRLSDHDVLVVPARDPDGMCAAKVIAPGLEVETLSYGRIGERALRQLLELDNGLVGLGEPDSRSRKAIRFTADARERVGSAAWIDVDAVQRTIGPLYPLYREPRRHAVQRLTG